ncbi:hypothetical protein OB03_13120 [Brevundimonas sp. GN22]
MTIHVAFRQTDIRRAIKAVESGGKSVAAVDFPPEGGFRLVVGEGVSIPKPIKGGQNEWDEVLPA